jgi:hypothetical protein
MKPQVFDSLFLASEVAKYADSSVYISQHNYMGSWCKFSLYFNREDISKEDPYLVAVFKVSPIKSSIPVMQVNKEGQLIAL